MIAWILFGVAACFIVLLVVNKISSRDDDWPGMG